MKQNLSLKFAKTLYKIALKSSSVEVFFEQLKGLEELFNDKECKHLLKKLENVDFTTIKTVVAETFKKSLQLPLENMLILLIANKDIRILPDIYRNFKKIYFQQEGISEFTVCSARSLDPQEREDLQKLMLPNLSKKEKKAHINFTHNPALIGGVQIYENDRLTDFSIKNKLTILKQKLLQ